MAKAITDAAIDHFARLYKPEMQADAFTAAAKAFGKYTDERGGPERPWMCHEAWAAAVAAVRAYEKARRDGQGTSGSEK